jgi:serine/threonine protein phosphatase PrpC
MANLHFTFKTDWGPLEGMEGDSFFYKDNLFIVVEGLGGDYGGKIARDISCRVISDSFFQHMSEIHAPAEAITQALLETNQAFIDEAKRLESKIVASVSVVYIQDHIMYFSHLGDSRIYSIHGSKINQLTRDHTLQEEAPIAPLKSNDSRIMQALTEGLGINQQPNIEVKKYPLERRDLVILTTDGFTSRISNKEILRYSQKYRNIETMSHNILELAWKKGGNQGMTLGIIRYGVFSRATKAIITAYTSFALVIVLVVVWYLAQFGGQKTGTEKTITASKVQQTLKEPKKDRPQTEITNKQTKKIIKPAPLTPVVKEEKSISDVNNKSINAFLEKWKSAWEKTAGKAPNMNTYISFYSRDFLSRGMNRDAWKKDKSSKGSRKQWIRVGIERIKISEPSEDNTVKVSFFQKYSSSNYSSQSEKVLILKKENNEWKIYREISD